MIYILIPVLIVVIAAVILFLYLTVTEYKPKKEEIAIIKRNIHDQEEKNQYTITTYNIGYCAHDKKTNINRINQGLIQKERREFVFDNMIAISDTITTLDSDFVLLQEVDILSARSANIDQIEYITTENLAYNATFAYNYKAKYVPFPINKPLGGTQSGLLTLSKNQILETTRYQLDGGETYPKSIFFLKRCMMINQYQVNKKTLYIINIHLSSYDKNGLFRTEQFHDMLTYIFELYDGRKNAIIVGGDFNYLMDKSLHKLDTPFWLETFPEELQKSKFKHVLDSNINSMQSSDGREYIIDGFIVSPNIKVLSCKTTDQGFEYSNHHPVSMTFSM